MLMCDHSEDRGKFSQFHEHKITPNKESLYVSTRPIWSVCMCVYCQLRKRVTVKGLKSHDVCFLICSNKSP